ncbi:MAG: hypothetical protein JSU86_00395 [Phycisphaerales bacterium]|nr:MAG: hypothetical protein JSU86_00395 [Phycisphaerales bacterium]
MIRHREKAPVIAAIAGLWVLLPMTPAMALDDLSLNVAPGSESVMPGDTVNVTLEVANLSAAINGVQALMHYDDTLLTLLSIVPEDLQLIPPAEGWVEVYLADTNGDVDYAIVANGGDTTAAGPVATLIFQAIGEGATTVTFRAGVDPFRNKLMLAVDNSTVFPPTTNSGAITITCDDGLFCNGLETFVGGSCQPGTPPDCSVLTDQCNDGVCNETTDACEPQPVNEGLPCDDSDLCTENDVCTSGVCAGTAVDCSHLDDVCNVGVCNDQTGLCEAQPANEGGSCDNGVFCDGTESCNLGVCVSSGDPCTPLVCDEANDQCLAPIHVANLEVFYAGRYGTCVGGNRDGLDCSTDSNCVGTDPIPDGICAFPEQPDPSRSFLAAGTTATINNITSYVLGITGIRVLFNDVVSFATTSDAAFSFEWSERPECVGGTNHGQSCNPENPNDQCILGGGICDVNIFTPVTNAASAITVTPSVQGGATVVDITLADNHVRARWLKVTIDSTQVTASGVELDGEMSGNPVVLPSGDGTGGGNAVFYLGNMPGDADGNRKTELTDPYLIRNCTCFNPFLFVPITEPYDMDKDVKVRLSDVGAARADVNPFFKLPLISP